MEWEHSLNHKVKALVAYKENGKVYWNIKDYNFKTQNVFFGVNEYYVREYVKKYGDTFESFEEAINVIGNCKYCNTCRETFGEVLVYRTEPYEHCCVRRVDLYYSYNRNRVFVEYVNKNNSNTYDISGAERILPLTNEFAFDIMYFANFGKSLLHKER